MRQPQNAKGAEAEVSPVERLLAAAAEFEPECPPPGVLTAGGVALLLARDADRRRRTVRARVAAFSTFLAGAGACSASLVLALTPSKPRVATSQPPVQSTVAPSPERAAAAELPAAELSPSQPPAATRPSVTPQRVTLASRSHPRRRVKRKRRRAAPAVRVNPAPEVPAAPVWTDETVEHQLAGVLADAWIVQQREDGTLAVAPAVLDLPLETTQSISACGSGGEDLPVERPANHLE